ncbi:MAG TPA: GNAT family N-acetyltransferase [Candidatus Dormibacteraeota bacterium]
MHALTQSAFEAYRGVLDPPSGAMRENVDSVRHDLEIDGGAMAWIGGEAVGCLRFEVEPDHLHVRRVAVLPERQRQGIGTALMMWSHEHALSLGLHEVRLGVRTQLPGNQAFYKRLGYRVIARHHHPGQRRVTWHQMSLRL